MQTCSYHLTSLLYFRWFFWALNTQPCNGMESQKPGWPKWHLSSFMSCPHPPAPSPHPSCYSTSVLTLDINHSLHPSSSSTWTMLVQLLKSPSCSSIKPNSYSSQKLRLNAIFSTKFFPADPGHHIDLSFLLILMAFGIWYSVTKWFYSTRFLICQHAHGRLMQTEWVLHSMNSISLPCNSHFNIEKKLPTV